MIGTLIYAAIGTRPDITFAAMRLSQYNNNPTEEHTSIQDMYLDTSKAQKNSKSNTMEVQMPD